MIYATCSILPEENSEQIKDFITKQADAELISIPEDENNIGWQLLAHPNKQDNPSMDGFYYAKLKKLISHSK